jgi:hypothetical protein
VNAEVIIFCCLQRFDAILSAEEDVIFLLERNAGDMINFAQDYVLG